jgi:hypothetical protein
MRRFLVVLLASWLPSTASAQSARDSVLAVVDEFFRTMTARDSAGFAGVLRADGLTFSIVPAGDSVVIRRRTNDTDLAGLARGTEKWLERMWEPTVLVHNQLATVWTPYDFYRDGKFSHCGVDVFTLLRENGRWRIALTAYTVERTGCPPSPLGPPR